VLIPRTPPSGRWPTNNFLKRNKNEKKVGLQHADLFVFMLKNIPKLAHRGSTSKVFILRMPPLGRYPPHNFLQHDKKEKKVGRQQANFDNFVSMLKNTPKIASLGSTSGRGAYFGNAPLWRRNSTGNFL
jgi:hypothetical protein